MKATKMPLMKTWVSSGRTFTLVESRTVHELCYCFVFLYLCSCGFVRVEGTETPNPSYASYPGRVITTQDNILIFSWEKILGVLYGSTIIFNFEPLIRTRTLTNNIPYNIIILKINATNWIIVVLDRKPCNYSSTIQLQHYFYHKMCFDFSTTKGEIIST